MNLGFIPCLWADDGDCVLVDDVQYAVKAAPRLGCGHADVLFLSAEQLKGIVFDGIEHGAGTDALPLSYMMRVYLRTCCRQNGGWTISVRFQTGKIRSVLLPLSVQV